MQLMTKVGKCKYLKKTFVKCINLLSSNNDLITVSVSGLSSGKIAGICAVAVGVLLLMAASVCVICFSRVKRKGEYYISDGKSDFFLFFFSYEIVL